jgi:DnaK suppressor protein
MPAKKPAARTGKPRKSATKATAAKKPTARKPKAPKAKAKAKPKRAAVRRVAAKSARKSPKKVPAKRRKAAPAKASKAAKSVKTSKSVKASKPAKAVKASKATARTRSGTKTVAKHKATASRSSAKSAGVKVKAKAAPRKPAVKAAVKPAKAAKRAAPAPRKAARPPKVVAMPSRARQAEAVAEDEEGYEGEGRHDLLMGPRNVKPYIQRRGESYMSTTQLQHFQTILSSWKRDLMEEVDRTVTHMKDEAANPPDPNDRATLESEFALELRTRDRERKLIRKIEEALKRIDDGSYGFCLETGEPIGVKRLEARPVATLCIEAQERRERRERQYGDRDDWYR